jgi:hypothetical protein
MFLLKWLKPKENPEQKEFISNIIDGNQLTDLWGVDAYELSYIILRKNLSILDLPKKFKSKSKYNPNCYKIDPERLLDIVQNNPWSLLSRAFWIPEIYQVADYVDYFKRKKPKEEKKTDPDLMVRFSKSWKEKPQLKYSRKESSSPKLKEEKEIKPYDEIKDIIEEHEDDIKKNPNVFLLIGKVWFVKFKNEEWGLFPDHEKYEYIAHLLKQTKTDPDNLEHSVYNDYLISEIKKIDAPHGHQDKATEEDLSETDFGNELTYEEISSLKEIGYNLLRDQIREKNDHNSKNLRKLEDDFKIYQSYLLNEYGIKSNVSKDRSKIYFRTYHRSSKENEKLRQLIKNQINNAVKDFKNRMPMFGSHLQNSLKTKLYKTLYTPEYSIQWQISL